MFLEHEIHDGDYKIYAGGSKSNEGEGLAVFADDFCDTAKLPPSALVYTAELSAIIEAMNMAYYTNNKSSFVIYSSLGLEGSGVAVSLLLLT